MQKLLLSLLFLATTVFASENVKELHANSSSVHIVPSILKKRVVDYSASLQIFEIESDNKKAKKDKKKVCFVDGLISKQVTSRLPVGCYPMYFTCMGIDFRYLKSNKDVKLIKSEILHACITP